jgi:hypothetical protein
MAERIDPFTATTAFGVAAYVAIITDCVACGQFGWSETQIRSAALLAAACVALGLALDFLGRRWRNAD